jgi:hypothetical protein
MLRSVNPADPRLATSIAAFDEKNAEDPTRIEIDGVETPRELALAKRLSHWVLTLDPDASPALRLAARCQHLMRWKVPRSEFPQGRSGYLKWRRHLAELHADQATAILRALGWDDDTVAAVRRINLKQDPKLVADVQTMEDALCLSFIENELLQFARTRSEDELARVLRKTWRKMSPHGQSFAPALLESLPETLRTAVQGALAAG